MEVSFGGSVLFVLMGVRDDVCVCVCVCRFLWFPTSEFP